MTARARTRRWIVPGVVVLLALTLCAPAGANTLFATVWRGGSRDAPLRQGAILIRSADELVKLPLSVRTRPDAGPLRVDFRRYLLVAASVGVANQCGVVDIVKLARTRRTLTVSVVASYLNTGCTQAVGVAYHIVNVRRAQFRGLLPRRAVLKVTRWNDWGVSMPPSSNYARR